MNNRIVKHTLIAMALAGLLLQGCKNKKQQQFKFKRDVVEYIGLVDKVYNSPKYLVPVNISEARNKLDLIKIDHSEILAEQVGIRIILDFMEHDLSNPDFLIYDFFLDNRSRIEALLLELQ